VYLSINVQLISQTKSQLEFEVQLKHIINFGKAGQNENRVGKERRCHNFC